MPSDHPLRRILPLVGAALTEVSAEFAQLYAAGNLVRLPKRLEVA